jgi:hypothetical protein
LLRGSVNKMGGAQLALEFVIGYELAEVLPRAWPLPAVVVLGEQAPTFPRNGPSFVATRLPSYGFRRYLSV